MKIAGKTVCVFVLFTITKVMRTVGESNWEQSAVRMEAKCAEIFSFPKSDTACGNFLLLLEIMEHN